MSVETKADAQRLQILVCGLNYDGRYVLNPTLRPKNIEDLLQRVGPELERIYTTQIQK